MRPTPILILGDGFATVDFAGTASDPPTATAGVRVEVAASDRTIAGTDAS